MIKKSEPNGMRKKILYTLYVMSGFISMLQAQSKLDSLQHLPEAIVTVDAIKEIIPGQRLSGKELEKLSSFSVADAIRYFSGVQIKDYGGLGGLKTVNIRSMGANHTGVFYDGVQLENAQNGQVDLGKFSLDNIEYISLHNGQKSSIFQPAKDYGAAGSIYIQTKRPVFAADKNHNFDLRIKTGSFMLFNPSLRWEQKLKKGYSFSLNGELISSDGKYPFRYKRVFKEGFVAYDTTATRKNGDITAVRAEAFLFKERKDEYWDVHGYYYYSHRGLPGFIVKNVWGHGQRLYDEDYFIQGKYEKKICDFYSTKLNVKYSSNYNRYIDRDWTSPTYVDNKYRQESWYVSSANKLKVLPCLQFNIAVDFTLNKMDANMPDFSYPTRNSLLTAIAGEVNIEWLKLQISGLGTFIHEKVKKNAPAPGKQILTPAVILSLKPYKDKELNITAFYKKIFRMPTFNDLYYTFIGTRTLKPEYALQYDLGVNYRISSSLVKFAYIQANVYYNEITDKIIAMPANNPYFWTMVNLGKVDIRGAEIKTDVAVEAGKNLMLTLKLNYTYQKAVDKTSEKDKYYRHQIPYIPWHSGSAIASLEYKSWGMNYSFIYAGKRYNAKHNNTDNEMQPWYTNDISFRKDFSGRHRIKYRILLDINNMMNQHYEVVLSYPMPGRNFRLTFDMTF